MIVDDYTAIAKRLDEIMAEAETIFDQQDAGEPEDQNTNCNEEILLTFVIW